MSAAAVIFTGTVDPPNFSASCEEFGLEPDPAMYCVEFTNDTGEPAGFLHIQAIASLGIRNPIENPSGCGEPKHWSGFEYHELVWPEPCVEPGESVAFHLSKSTKTFSPYFAPSPPLIVAVNDADRPAHGLTIDRVEFYKGVVLVQNADGCSQPIIENDGELRLLWDSDCVDPGEVVSVHVGAPTAVTSAPYTWSLAVIYGDASCNEMVDAVDAALVLQFAAGLLDALPCAGAADVNGDGATDAEDAAMILQFRVGLLNSLPV